MVSNTTLTNCANITTATWSIGQHNISIWVNDTAGNKNNAAITFNVQSDLDNDNVPDINDPLLYNETNVTVSGITNLNITVGGNRTNETYSGVKQIVFYDLATPLVNFTHNFSQTNLDLSNITIIKTTTSIIVNLSGQLQSNYNKTMYIADNSFIGLCVKNAEVNSVDDISTACTGTNETNFVTCLGSSARINGINCTDLGTIIKIENLQYSGIRGTQATPSTPDSSNNGGGGGEGSAAPAAKVAKAAKIPDEIKYQCTSDDQCPWDETCHQNQCVKLFDVKLLDIVHNEDGLVDFTYFIKGMAKINDDVTVNFWLAHEKDTISSGQDVIYMGEFEEKTESAKIYVPKNITPGEYEFFLQVGYRNYEAISHRTVYIEQGDQIKVTLQKPSPVGADYILVSEISLLLIILITLGILYLRRKRKLSKQQVITIPIKEMKKGKELIEVKDVGTTKRRVRIKPTIIKLAQIISKYLQQRQANKIKLAELKQKQKVAKPKKTPILKLLVRRINRKINKYLKKRHQAALLKSQQKAQLLKEQLMEGNFMYPQEGQRTPERVHERLPEKIIVPIREAKEKPKGVKKQIRNVPVIITTPADKKPRHRRSEHEILNDKLMEINKELEEYENMQPTARSNALIRYTHHLRKEKKHHRLRKKAIKIRGKLEQRKPKSEAINVISDFKGYVVVKETKKKPKTEEELLNDELTKLNEQINKNDE
jgi:hypothetical protein